MPAPFDKDKKKKILIDYYYYLDDKSNNQNGNYTDENFVKKYGISRTALRRWVGNRESFMKDYSRAEKKGTISRPKFSNYNHRLKELLKSYKFIIIVLPFMFFWWPIAGWEKIPDSMFFGLKRIWVTYIWLFIIMSIFTYIFRENIINFLKKKLNLK